MVYDERANEYVLSSGRRVYANNGIVGIDPGGGTYEGYDGGFSAPDDFTADERAEIADMMIARWTAWRENRVEAGATITNTYAEQPVGRAVPNMGALVAQAWDDVMSRKNRPSSS